mmetsp:Transcript_53010/g.115672  ORF Transcript_53010/g.115672 Transcript_53010/m.115672 type:complete len:259 (-) Transcript_53010:2679-3455(-)
MVHRHVQFIHQDIGSREDQILRGSGLSQDVDIQEVCVLLAMVGQNHSWELLAEDTSLVLPLMFKHGTIHTFGQLTNSLQLADAEVDLFFVFRHILFVAQLNVSHVNEEQLARGGFVIHQGNSQLAKLNVDLDCRSLIRCDGQVISSLTCFKQCRHRRIDVIERQNGRFTHSRYRKHHFETFDLYFCPPPEVLDKVLLATNDNLHSKLPKSVGICPTDGSFFARLDHRSSTSCGGFLRCHRVQLHVHIGCLGFVGSHED